MPSTGDVWSHRKAALFISTTVAASQAGNACSSPVLVTTIVARFASGITQTARPSMADTLRQSFGLADASGADLPGQRHVRSAYARLEAFGL